MSRGVSCFKKVDHGTVRRKGAVLKAITSLLIIVFLVFPGFLQGAETLADLKESLQAKIEELQKITRQLSEDGKALGKEVLEQGKVIREELLENGKDLGEKLIEEGKLLGEEFKQKTETFLKMSKASGGLKKEIKTLTQELIELECADQPKCWETEAKKIKKRLKEACGPLPLVFEIEKRLENQQCRKFSLLKQIRKGQMV